MRRLTGLRKTCYQGTVLSPSEVEVLTKLERLLGRSIPQIVQIDIDRPLTQVFLQLEVYKKEHSNPCFGITIEQNQVTGLALDSPLRKSKLVSGGLAHRRYRLDTSSAFPPFPEYIGKLTNLRVLSLRESQLAEVPTFLNQLTQLQELDLSANQLTSLSKNFGQLTSLKKLKLQNNRFSSLPESLSQLKGLQALDVSNKDPFSETGFRMTRIHWIPRYFTQNRLESLPESLGQLRGLQALDVSNNKITSLPETIGRLDHLTSLNLAGNRLEALPTSFSQLKNLQRLNLSDNPLSQLSLSNMVSLFRPSENNVKILGYNPFRICGHPLVKPLDRRTISITNQVTCPLCGASEVLTGQDDQTGQERYICPQCENIIK
ncbi:MAG: leucine-rich repeat domain-containing protein [Candidatus Hermodarchaeota archaeon]